MKSERFESIWDAIEDTPAEAANMKVRAQLLADLQKVIEKRGWSQAEAAKALGLTQPRVSEIARGKISAFSIDKLVAILAAAGGTVEVRTLVHA